MKTAFFIEQYNDTRLASRGAGRMLPGASPAFDDEDRDWQARGRSCAALSGAEGLLFIHNSPEARCSFLHPQNPATGSDGLKSAQR